GGRGDQPPAAPRRLRPRGRRDALRARRPRARRARVQGHDAHRRLRPRRLDRDLPGQPRGPRDEPRRVPAGARRARALRHAGPGHYRIAGAGRYGLQEPGDVIDCGNSGTTARLLLGMLAGQSFWTLLTGDASLRQRPMARVTEPLGRMGAAVVGRAQATRLPLAVKGRRPLWAIAYTSPVASAQVKSAILLAGLYAAGPVSVEERSEEHTSGTPVTFR